MTLRELINLAYAALARGKDEGELAEFDAKLEAEPGKNPRLAPPMQRSRNVGQLMAAVGLASGPPPRKKPER